MLEVEPDRSSGKDWIIGVDGAVAYHNDHYEPDERIAVIEAELAAAAAAAE